MIHLLHASALLELEDLLNLVEEKEIGDSLYRFEGGDQEIIDTVVMQARIRAGEADAAAEDEDEDGVALDRTSR